MYGFKTCSPSTYDSCSRKERVALSKNIQAQIENPLARHYVEGNTYMCTGKLDSKTEFLILYKS